MFLYMLNIVIIFIFVIFIEVVEDQMIVVVIGSIENMKKGVKRKNVKYEIFFFKEEQYLVNLWKENFE